MFNPFVPLSPDLLNALVRAGKKYFVRQTFPRGQNILDENIKGYFLYSHYSDMPAALTHYGVLKDDPHRFLFDWDKKEDQIRLVKAANGVEGYKIFANILYDDTDKRVSSKLQQSIRGYIRYKLNWFPARNDGLETHFYTHLGELYIELKFRNHEVRVPLIQVENLKI